MSVNDPGPADEEAPPADTVPADTMPADTAPADGTAPADDEAPGAAAKPAARKPKSRGRSFWIEFPVLVVVALVLALVLKTYVVQAFYIPSGSMQNTLAIGDRILINKVVYHFRGIARGDIVVFNGDGSWNPEPPPSSSNPFSRFLSDIEGIVGSSEGGDIYIKRVIGLPGDHVVCCNAKGQITVNGVALSETSYLYPGNVPSSQAFNITVPKGRLWVMGDHRQISADSRYHMQDPGDGTIPESSVLGRAFVKIWPPSQWGFLNIPGTFSQPKLNAAAAAATSPLVLGFAGAVPLTALEAVVRRRTTARWSRRRSRRSRSRRLH